MYDDKDSEERRCDTCEYEFYTDEETKTCCKHCYLAHMTTPPEPRLPYWTPKDIGENVND